MPGAIGAAFCALVVFCALAASASRADTPDPLRRLSGASAWQALVGNTVTGQTPDGPYADYFSPDGTVVHSDRDGTDRGRWTFREDAVCLSFPEDDAVDCRTPEVEGEHGAFVDRDGSRYPFDVLKGNAKGL